MTLSPIVWRELRVAARRAETYWLRCLAAAFALAMGCIALLWSRHVGPAEMGSHLLNALGILTMALSLFAGIFLTADCLAEEKREGTLGLLFLTDLKAYDVVLGKLAAASLHAIFGLVAIFPVLALPLMMGGVSGRGFGRLLLVFATTLFFSLNLGMLVSVYSREARQALTRGVLWLVVFAGVFPSLWWLFIVWFRSLPHDFLFWPSPVCAFVYGFDQQYAATNGSRNFWISTGLVLLLACVFLVWTSLVLPLCWRHTGGAAASKRGWFRRKMPEVKAGMFVRRRVYRENPACWLAMGDGSSRSQVNRALSWLAPLWFIFLVASLFSPLHEPAFCACFFLAYGLHLLVKVLFATDASQRMFRERQSGTFELLLVTPLAVAEILAAQRQALKHHFQGALLTLCAINLLMAWVAAVFPGLLNMNWQEQGVFLEVFLGGLLMLWLDLRALAWVGMWRGLKARRSQRATLAALGQIMGIPWLIIFFIVITRRYFDSDSEAALTIAVWLVAGALIDLVIGRAARKKLVSQFRSTALQRFQPDR